MEEGVGRADIAGAASACWEEPRCGFGWAGVEGRKGGVRMIVMAIYHDEIRRGQKSPTEDAPWMPWMPGVQSLRRRRHGATMAGRVWRRVLMGGLVLRKVGWIGHAGNVAVHLGRGRRQLIQG